MVFLLCTSSIYNFRKYVKERQNSDQLQYNLTITLVRVQPITNQLRKESDLQMINIYG